MKKVSVALFGFGNVGRAFAQYLTDNSVDIRIDAIADSSGGLILTDDLSLERAAPYKEASQSLSEMAPGQIISDHRAFIRALPDAGINMLVECLPTNIVTGEPGLSLITEALKSGINVVTVDKGPLVHGFETLQQRARASGVQIRYTGTTGVGIPSLLAGDRVVEIRGVLNGTTNYVLTEMQRNNRSFQDALAQAQADGIAEPDPSLDIEGWDTASKILILAKSLMGAEARLDDVSRIGIGPETESLIRTARDSGRVVRLVGRARIWQGSVRVSVAPKLLRQDSPFYSVSGTSKAAAFRTQNAGEVIAKSLSGRDEIAKVIVDDIAKIQLEP
jgi:homoserine dehydrogenase